MRTRYATYDDARALVGIYNHYVNQSYATFDESTRTEEEEIRRLQMYKPFGAYRCLVAEDDDGAVIGVASTNPYRAHPSFRKTVEISIYLAPRAVGKGVGTKLLLELLQAVRFQDLHVAVSGIALPNEPSMALHRKCGFEQVGIFKEYAIKNDIFISSAWMQKILEREVPTLKGRRALNRDQPEIQNLIFSILREYRLDPDPASTDADLSDIEEFYFSQNGWFEVVFNSKGELIGTWGLVQLDDDTCELRKMYLRSRARGSGAGKFLLEQALIKANEFGYKSVELETASVLKEAIGLYEKYGFRPFEKRIETERCDQCFRLNLR